MNIDYKALMVRMGVSFAGGFFGALQLSPRLDMQSVIHAAVAGGLAAGVVGKVYLEVPISKTDGTTLSKHEIISAVTAVNSPVPGNIASDSTPSNTPSAQ